MTYDLMILNEIGKREKIEIDELSSIIKCSSYIIIERIEYLLEEDLICFDDDKFHLTPSGKNLSLPYDFSFDINDNYEDDIEFDCHKFYLPSKNIFD